MKDKPLSEKVSDAQDFRFTEQVIMAEDVKEAVEKLKNELYGKFNGWMPEDNLELWGEVERRINKIFGEFK